MCGTKVEDVAKFCGKCGHSINVSTNQSKNSESVGAPTEDQKKDHKEQTGQVSETPSPVSVDKRKTSENDPEGTQLSFGESSDPNVAKKKKKGLPIFLTILGAIVLSVLLYFGYPLLFGDEETEAEEIEFTTEASSGYWVLSDESEISSSSEAFSISFEPEQLTMALYLDEETYKVAENGESSIETYEISNEEIEGNRATIELTDSEGETQEKELELTKTEERKSLTVIHEDESVHEFTEVSEEEYIEAGGSNLREYTEDVAETADDFESIESLWGNSYISYANNGIEYEVYTFLSPEQAENYEPDYHQQDINLEGGEGLLVYQLYGFSSGIYRPNINMPEAVILDIEYDLESEILTVVTDSFDANDTLGEQVREFHMNSQTSFTLNDNDYHLADGEEYADSSIEKVWVFDFEVEDIFGYYFQGSMLNTFYVDDSIVYAPEFDGDEDLIFNVETIEVEDTDVTFSGEGQSLTFRVDHYENRFEYDQYDLITKEPLLIYYGITDEQGREYLPEFDPQEESSSSGSNLSGSASRGSMPEIEDLWETTYGHTYQDQYGYDITQFISFVSIDNTEEFYLSEELSSDMSVEDLRNAGVIGKLDYAFNVEFENPMDGIGGLASYPYILDIRMDEQTNIMTIETSHFFEDAENRMYEFEFTDSESFVYPDSSRLPFVYEENAHFQKVDE